jgi:competence protein ComEA
MFGRRHSSDPDVVAAARRRLAALAAESPVRATASTGDEHQRSEFDGGGDQTARSAPQHAAASAGLVSRLGVNAQHVTVTALLVVGLVVGVAWWALRSVPSAHPVDVSSRRAAAFDGSPAPPSSPANPAPASSAGGVAVGGAGTSPSSASVLVVDVAGKVRRPGIVELPPGSRVVDAIAAAGGARPGVSLTSLNLARLLVDGEQILVGVDVPAMGGAGPMAGAQSTADGAISPVNLNTATAEQLDTLPDVGPVTAQAILQWRLDNGPFSSVDDLLDVSGIGEATMADLRPYVYV